MQYSPDPYKSSESNSIPAAHAHNRSALSITVRVFQLFWKAIWSVILVALITGFICAAAVFSYLYSMKDVSVDFDLNAITLNQTSYVYTQDSNSGVWSESAQFRGVENREWVNLNQIPKNLVNAFISTETSAFISTVAWTGSVPDLQY